METIFIALGSNLGDRAAYLAQGRRVLAQVMKLDQSSRIYETPPWGVLEQPAYLNQVVQGQTSLQPLALLAFLKEQERAAGRTEGIRFGPRVLDLDILFYGQQIIQTETLQIPHPRIAERAFVLVPMAEIAPQWVHPVLAETISDLLQRCTNQEEIHPYDPSN